MLEKKSIAQTVYDEIKERIIKREYAPRTSIN